MCLRKPGCVGKANVDVLALCINEVSARTLESEYREIFRRLESSIRFAKNSLAPRMRRCEVEEIHSMVRGKHGTGRKGVTEFQRHVQAGRSGGRIVRRLEDTIRKCLAQR